MPNAVDYEAIIKPAMTDDWQTADEIAAKIDRWTGPATRRYLNMMVESGDIERKRQGVQPTGYKMLYRRVQHADQA